MKKSIVTIFICLIALFGGSKIVSQFFNNFGWLQLNKIGFDVVACPKLQQKNIELFQNSIDLNSQNQRAYLGAGLMQYNLGNSKRAITIWEDGSIQPDLLVGYGQQKEETGHLNDALFFYDSATKLNPGNSDFPQILTGNICQRTFADNTRLTIDWQNYCRNYFLTNNDNLIVNGDFETGDLSGWSERRWSGFSGWYLIETQKDNSIALIHGVTNNEIGTLSQSINFSSGTTINFSARIKAELAPGAKARLLHIVWIQQDGSTNGQKFQEITKSIDWQFFEKKFQLTGEKNTLYIISPVLLVGEGKIWFDDVELQVISN